MAWLTPSDSSIMTPGSLACTCFCSVVNLTRAAARGGCCCNRLHPTLRQPLAVSFLPTALRHVAGAQHFQQLTDSMEARQQLDVTTRCATAPSSQCSWHPTTSTQHCRLSSQHAQGGIPFGEGAEPGLRAAGSAADLHQAWGGATTGSHATRRSKPARPAVAWQATLPPSAITFSASGAIEVPVSRSRLCTRHDCAG